MSGTYFPTSQIGKRVVAGEGSVQCELRLCPRGNCNHGIPVALARIRFLHLQGFLLVVGRGGTVGNSDHRGNERYMAGFLARSLKNLKNLSPEPAYLTQTVE